jgi:hypothetical protein
MVFFKFLGPLLGDSSGGAGVSEVSARHILVKTKEECQTIKDGIVKGDARCSFLFTIGRRIECQGLEGVR